jgi:mono/diheme cytochrome c family protein
VATPDRAAAQEARGKQLFADVANLCTTCHTVQGVSTATVGPELTHIGTVAGTRKPGMTAEQYIRESLQKPAAFVVPDFANLMPADVAAKFSRSDLDALVAYLLSLK